MTSQVQPIQPVAGPRVRLGDVTMDLSTYADLQKISIERNIPMQQIMARALTLLMTADEHERKGMSLGFCEDASKLDVKIINLLAPSDA